MRWVVVVALAGACVDSNSVVCGDGVVCPARTACDMEHRLCVAPEQLTACEGLEQAADCEFAALDRTTVAGKCEESVCLVPVCGNTILDVGEVCDVGDAASGDGCSADCTSDETCGNAIVDPTNPAMVENCDDGNNVGQDGCTSTCVAEVPHWVAQGNGSPPARYAPAMAYDAYRGSVVLFGGSNGSPLIDTWEWRGAWVEVSVLSAPTPIDDTAGVYMHELRHVVLTGGTRGGAANDSVLSFEGQEWRRIAADGPAMTLHGAAYDSRRKRVVTFGGVDKMGDPVVGTWEFDGTAWTQNVTATVPGPRKEPAMTYDAEHGVVLMYGGLDPTNATYLSDLWAYDGTNWTLRSTAGPPAMMGASLAFFAEQHASIMFGGKASAGLNGGTWAWDGSAWTQQFPANQPTARQVAGMCPDGHGRLMLFGGLDGSGATGDTWTYDGVNWRQLGGISAQSEATAAFDVDRHRIVIAPGKNILQTWVLSDAGVQVFSTTPGASASVGLAYDEKRHEMLAYGGDDLTPASDLFAFDYAAGKWVRKAPAGSQPPPSVTGRLVYDNAQERVLLVGPTVAKMSPDAASTALWSWDGTSWSSVAVTTVVPPRLRPVVGFDRIRHQLVLYGGSDGGAMGGTLLRDTWVYDGTDWRQVPPPSDGEVPVPQLDVPMAWNAARGRLTMLDTGMTPWEWTGSGWEQVLALNRPPLRSAYTWAQSFDGSGVTMILGLPLAGLQQWQLRWDGPAPAEVCARPQDADGDGLTGCEDPDCWLVCTPQCSPGVSCAAGAPTCGDGACSEAENCFMCPGDCTCATVCGDFVCEPGEVSCPGDCP